MGLPIDGPCGLLAESYILKCELAIALQLQLVEGHQGQMMYHSLSLFAMRFGVCGGGLLARSPSVALAQCRGCGFRSGSAFSSRT